MTHLDTGGDRRPYSPITLAQAIPPNIRAAVYSILASLFAVELVLDASGYGLIPEGPQTAVVGVIGVLGFGLARANTSTGDEIEV